MHKARLAALTAGIAVISFASSLGEVVRSSAATQVISDYRTVSIGEIYNPKSVADKMPKAIKTKCSKEESVCFPHDDDCQLELEVVNDKKLTGRWREFYDPNHAGHPLLKVGILDLFKPISKHYLLADLARVIGSHGLIRNKYLHSLGGEKFYRYIRVDKEMLYTLDELVEKVGYKLPIKSGYRSDGLNRRMYQARNRRKIAEGKPPGKVRRDSRHISGDAVDLSVNYRKVRKHLAGLENISGIGGGPTLTHLDFRGVPVKTWYYGRYRRKRNKGIRVAGNVSGVQGL